MQQLIFSLLTMQFNLHEIHTIGTIVFIVFNKLFKKHMYTRNDL